MSNRLLVSYNGMPDPRADQWVEATVGKGWSEIGYTYSKSLTANPSIDGIRSFGFTYKRRRDLGKTASRLRCRVAQFEQIFHRSLTVTRNTP
jgi:hypothetical protein